LILSTAFLISSSASSISKLSHIVILIRELHSEELDVISEIASISVIASSIFSVTSASIITALAHSYTVLILISGRFNCGVLSFGIAFKAIKPKIAIIIAIR
jgi:hypothetical protein